MKSHGYDGLFEELNGDDIYALDDIMTLTIFTTGLTR